MVWIGDGEDSKLSVGGELQKKKLAVDCDEVELGTVGELRCVSIG